jgi:cysteine desulfuration protein SufE
MPRSVPPALQSIAALFEKCSDSERRELLLHYAAGAGRYAPDAGETFDVSDLRHDPECADQVGVHLRVTDGACQFNITLGPDVQTLTRALAAILCEGLAEASPDEVAALPESFLEEIAGCALTRLRRRSIHYLLRRMKEAIHSLPQGKVAGGQ